jgi:trehalose 6-phosphate phosphatase
LPTPEPSILAARHAPVLADFATSNVLVAFDYDGTLAPIVPTPATADMRPRTRRLLACVARRYPCVVISGRRVDDLARRLRGVPLDQVIGDHGSETSVAVSEPTRQVRQWMDELGSRFGSYEGISLEPKARSVTVHYRHARHRAATLAAIEAAIGRLRDARALHGSEAVTLLPRGGPDKGTALELARRQLACDTAIYVGDDDTDEDAFKAAPPERLLSVRVGATARSAAAYRLASQTDVDALLQTLLELRHSRPTSSRR